MAGRVNASFASVCVLGAIALVAPFQGCARPRIAVVEIVASHDQYHTHLGERGDVGLTVPDPGVAGGPTRALHWYRGETTPLTPDIPDDAWSVVNAVNGRGQVVGDVSGGGTVQAFVWTDGVTTMVPSSSGQPTSEDIDGSGRLLINWLARPLRAGVVDGDRSILSPDTPGGGTFSGTDMNDRGEVVGNEVVDLLEGGAYYWRVGSDPVDLGDSGGGIASAVAVNDAGSVLVSSTTDTGDERMFLWRDGQATDLGTLGGDETGDRNGFGARNGALNDHDQVVGGSFTSSSGNRHAFLWSDGTMRDLGTLGGDYSFALDVNDLGEVVGWSTTADGETHAFLWRDGTMTDLGARLPDPTRTSQATEINDRGQVLGWVNDPATSAEALVLWETRGRV